MTSLRKINNCGFSILEVISALFIFSVITLTIYSSFQVGFKSLLRSKHRVAAAALANEKMEIIRNLPYNSIGTEGGVPSGSLPQNEEVWKSNQRFDVHTYIRYVDDPFDGVEGGNPSDDIPTDYKEVKIEVTWAGVSVGHGVILVSKFVPDGVETNVGGGTLKLNVLDGGGEGIPGVSTRIVNDEVDPHKDISTFTDASGTALLVGMPPGDRNYQISISKDGYESVTTLPPYPESSFDPADVHASVIEGALNTKGIVINKLSNLRINSKDTAGQTLPNMHLNLKGGRVIGTEHGKTDELYSYDEENLSTGAEGSIELNDASPGIYYLELAEAGYTLIGSDVDLPIALAADENLEVSLIIADNEADSLVVDVLNSVTEEPIMDASVRLFNGTDFDETLVTGDRGQVYFPPSTDPPTVLEKGDYTLEVMADEYQSYSGNVSIDKLIQERIELTPS